MVNRILIRKKVVQIVYSYLKGDRDLNSAEKELFFALEKGYDLYYYLLLLMVDLTDLQAKRLQMRGEKYLPTEEEKNPNTRFVDNRFIKDLRQNADFVDYVASKKLTWMNESDFVRVMLDKILVSDVYEKYMLAEENTYDSDREFWRTVFKNIIMPDELLEDVLEDESLYWNDDIEIVGTFVLKTIKKFSEGSEESPILPMYKDEDDADFARQLFRRSVVDASKFQQMIEGATKNWDVDRLAFMDTNIMVVALAEITSFPSIPVKVSLNEYIEIAKCYSTQRSGKFVNGILDNIVSSLKKEGKLIKE